MAATAKKFIFTRPAAIVIMAFCLWVFLWVTVSAGDLRGFPGSGGDPVSVPAWRARSV